MQENSSFQDVSCGVSGNTSTALWRKAAVQVRHLPPRGQQADSGRPERGARKHNNTTCAHTHTHHVNGLAVPQSRACCCMHSQYGIQCNCRVSLMARDTHEGSGKLREGNLQTLGVTEEYAPASVLMNCSSVNRWAGVCVSHQTTKLCLSDADARTLMAKH